MKGRRPSSRLPGRRGRARPRSRRRLLGLVLGLLLALPLAELGLRRWGPGRWRPFPELASLPRLSEPDPVLGWVNAPGVHRWQRAGVPVEVHIEADGRRQVPGGALPRGAAPGNDSRPGEAGATRRAALYGGSFAFGFGVSDEESLAAQAQRAARQAQAQALRAESDGGGQTGGVGPELVFENRAVPGYGTWQSMLLEERVAAAGSAADIVVYGLVELHEGRNVAARSWLAALDRAQSAQGGGQGWGAVPRARVRGWALRPVGRAPLVTGSPVAYAHWPWSEESALVHLAERATIGLHDRFLRTKAETTARLLGQWRDRVEARGGRLVVAVLHLPSRMPFYRARLEADGLEWLDLRHPAYPERALPGDGHPDATIQRDQGEWLARALVPTLGP